MALITELDDRTLVEHHRAGDEDAFRRIVERHRRSLYANALRRLGDPVLAEDAVQEAFLRAFRNLARFDGAYHLDAWLHRIVTNTCHDIGRRQGRDTRLFDRACARVEAEAPAADDGLDATPADQLTDALDQLPESYREVLLLRFVDEMSYEDVALKAGISEENARARVSRGRAMLKRLMSSTSALVVWAIPSLRRSEAPLTGSEAEVANQAASQAHTLASLTNVASSAAPSVQSAPGFSHLSSLAAQAGPSIAQALPTATTTGSTLGKAAVAVGLAASMAIPTGVAVDRVRNKPAPAASEQLDAASPTSGASTPTTTVVAPTTTIAGSVGALGLGGAEVLTTTPKTSTSTVTSTPTTVIEQQTPTTTAPAPSTGTPAPAPATGGTDGGTSGEPTPPAPTAGPAGDLTAAALEIVDSGPRLVLSGQLSLVIGASEWTGRLEGRILFGKPDQKNPQAPVDVDGYLTLRLADGRSFTLSLAGTAVANAQGSQSAYDLTGTRFRLSNAADLGLAETGELKGSLERQGENGRLTIELPGAPAGQPSGS